MTAEDDLRNVLYHFVRVANAIVEAAEAWRDAAPARLPVRKQEIQAQAFYRLGEISRILGRGFSVRNLRRKILARQFPRGRKSGNDIIFVGRQLIEFFEADEEEGE